MNQTKLAFLNSKYAIEEELFTIELRDLNGETKDTILEILETASLIGNVGHSYEIYFDLEKAEDYKASGNKVPYVGWDGDGSARLIMEKQVFVNGEPYKEDNSEVREYVKNM